MSSVDFIQQGRSLLDQGDYQRAVRVFRQGLLSQPAIVEARVDLGRALLALNRFGEVLAEMRVVLNAEPFNSRALVLQGEALLGRGDTGKAVHVLTQAQAAVPDDPDIQELLRRARESRAQKSGLRPPSRRDLDYGNDDAGTRHYPMNQVPQSLQQQSRSSTVAAKPTAITAAADDALTDEDGFVSAQFPDRLSGQFSSETSTSSGTSTDSGTDSAERAASQGGFDAPTTVYRPSSGLDLGADPISLEMELSAENPVAGATDATAHYRIGPSRQFASQEPPAQRLPSDIAPLPAVDGPGERLGPAAAATADDRDPDLSPDPDLPPTSMIEVDSLLRGSSSSGSAPAGGVPRADSLRSGAALLASKHTVHSIPPPPVDAGGARQRSGGLPSSGQFNAGQPSTGALPVQATPRPTNPAANPVASNPAALAPTVPHRRLALPPQSPHQLPDEDAVTVPRRRIVPIRTSFYVLATVAVIAGGLAAGFQIREYRLNSDIASARERAREQAQSDTYGGYTRAQRTYEGIVAVRANLDNRARLARTQAVLAAEFGAGYTEAQATLASLDGVTDIADIAVARSYLALVEGNVEEARAQAQNVESLAANEPFGPYLSGRALMMLGRDTEAVAAFNRALDGDKRALFYIGLGQAHTGVGTFADAAKAYENALELVPGHPGALLGQAQTAIAKGSPQVPASIVANLTEVLAQGDQPLVAQELGVSPKQMATAALSIVSVRLLQNDRAGAEKALAQFRVMQPVADPDIAIALVGILYELGEIEEAINASQRALEQWPKRLDVRMALARVALGNSDEATALETLKQASNLSGNARALALRGRIHLALGNTETAVGDIDAALAIRNDLTDAVLARAEIDLRQRGPEAAVTRLAQTAQSSPAPLPALRVALASALRQSGRSDRARKEIEALAKEHPSGEVFLELARLERDEGRFARARNAYTKAIERVPGPKAALEYAQLQFDTGDRQGAQERLSDIATRFGGNPLVLLEAARVHTLSGKRTQAAQYLQQASAVKATPSWLLARERGRLALSRGDARAAVAALQEARADKRDDPETCLLLVDALLAAKEDKRAAKVAADADRCIGGRAPSKHLLRGRLALGADKPDEAIDAFKRARSLLDKRSALPRQLAEVSYHLGLAYYQNDRLRNARRELIRATRLDPGYVDAFFALGLVEFARNRLDRATNGFETALKLDANAHPESWFYLGEIWYQGKKRSKAKRAFREYLKLSPDGALIKEAKAYLKELR